MMTFRNQLFRREVEVVAVQVAEGDIREDGEVAVRGDLLRHKEDLKVLHLPMHQLGRRMLASRVQTIVVVAEVAIEAFTPMPGVRVRVFPFNALHYFGTVCGWLGVLKSTPWMVHVATEFSFICHNTKHCIALGFGWGSGGNSVTFSARFVHTRSQSINNRVKSITALILSETLVRSGSKDQLSLLFTRDAS